MEEQGVIIKSTGKWYVVRDKEGKEHACRMRGKFRMAGIRTTNPLAVGDHVRFKLEEDEKGTITTIEERKNYILRRSVNLSHQAHIVAANVDQALLMATLADPPTSTGFMDRFLVSAEAYQIPVIILFNKLDLYDDEDIDELAERQWAYEAAGYKVMHLSVEKDSGVDEVKALMAGKTSMIGGHSGVGKSSLANAIEPGLGVRVGEVSQTHFKGQHTTTFAEMHPLSFGGYLIDTPGIKGFGLVEIDPKEMHMYFPEMRALLPDCKFHNCTHTNEPKCAVKAAVENEELAPFRYENYLNLFNSDEEQMYRS